MNRLCNVPHDHRLGTRPLRRSTGSVSFYLFRATHQQDACSALPIAHQYRDDIFHSLRGRFLNRSDVLQAMNRWHGGVHLYRQTIRLRQ